MHKYIIIKKSPDNNIKLGSFTNYGVVFLCDKFNYKMHGNLGRVVSSKVIKYECYEEEIITGNIYSSNQEKCSLVSCDNDKIINGDCSCYNSIIYPKLNLIPITNVKKLKYIWDTIAKNENTLNLNEGKYFINDLYDELNNTKQNNNSVTKFKSYQTETKIIFSANITKTNGWIKFYNKGISWKNLNYHPMLFSERNKLTKYIKIRNWLFKRTKK